MTLIELNMLMPEIILLSMASLILIIDAFLPDDLRDLTYQLSQGTLIGVGLVIFSTYPQQTELALHGMFVTDPMGATLKLFIVGIVFFTFLYSRSYLKERNFFKGEYFTLGLFATLGMLIMVSAHNMLVIYLGLELLSLSLYAMVAMHRDSQSATEAAMKYFVLGAIASGILLYGMSMLYGMTGTLDLNELSQSLSTLDEYHTALVFGLVFIVVGLAFKLGAVPFHMWVPDVYQGSPTSVTLFISSAPKLAAFAMVMRLLVDGMGHLHSDWQDMLILLSILSMAIGNIVAISQTNIKRMLAYSTISHVGFLLLGILTADKAGYAASMFYVVSYALMTLGGFGMILLLSRAGFEAENISDYKGLNERNSWFAFIMLILMLSMMGVPPMLGFWAKFSVVMQLINSGMLWLAIVAVLFAVIGAFYYLRIIWMMYFEKPEETAPIEDTMDMRVAVSANGLLVLGLGLMPHTLMTICLSAFSLV